MDSTTKHAMTALAIFAFASLGCISLFDNGGGGPADVDESGCGTFDSDQPMLGYAYRGEKPLTEDCDAIPVEAGFQGGYHFTPLVWVPDPYLQADKTGVATITVTFLEHSVDTIERENEVFDEWWVDAPHGAYFSQQVGIGNSLVEHGGRWPVQVDVVIDFDDPAAEDITLTRQTVLQR